MTTKINEHLCIILNAVAEDYQTIWEIISVLRSYYVSYSEEFVYLQSFESLKKLLDYKFVQAFEGRSFDGDEILLDDFELSFEFVFEHRNDWETKNFNDIDVRFFITEAGEQALINDCSHNLFSSS